MKIKTAAPPVPPDAPPGLEGWLFKPIPRPAFTDALFFPDDVTKCSLSDVSRLHGQYTALYAYVVSECAKLGQEALRIESELFVRKNNVTRTGLTYGKNKYKIDVEVRADMSMEKLHLKLHKVREHEEVTKRYLEIYDRYIAALSREMTRRTAEMKQL